MPKIGKKKEVGMKEASPSPKIEKKVATTVPSATRKILLAENQLNAFDSDTLDKILLCYGVDMQERKKKEKKTRVTDAYKREIILESQTEWLKTNKETPDGLYELLGSEKDKFGQVDVRLGLTINMGDYSSLRIEAGVNLPINHTEADKEAAKNSMLSAIEMVKEFINEETPRAKAEISNNYS